MEAKREFVIGGALLASPRRRLANFIIDLIVIYALIFVLFIIIGIVDALNDNNELGTWAGNISDGAGTLIFLVLMILYYTFFEGYSSRSVAKYITKTLIVHQDGSELGFGASFKRSLCRIIPFDGFTFLFGNRGWHDSISDTYVVKKEVYERERKLFYSFEKIETVE